jgi:PIN domain
LPAESSARARRTATLIAFLDTNVLIRHLTGDPPEMAARATTALAGEEQLLLTDLLLAECVYVLESLYVVEHSRIAELMRSVIAFPSIDTVDPLYSSGPSRSTSSTGSILPRRTLLRTPRRLESARFSRSIARSTGSRP